eukprot:GHVP01036489.1.p1 GENE.GHVP01036489.1~~GHVP01036489.1.p1  ORF type:complete len:730 (+),score=132.47 GHVP01036489.1:1906-4095(+)
MMDLILPNLLLPGYSRDMAIFCMDKQKDLRAPTDSPSKRISGSINESSKERISRVISTRFDYKDLKSLLDIIGPDVQQLLESIDTKTVLFEEKSVTEAVKKSIQKKKLSLLSQLIDELEKNQKGVDKLNNQTKIIRDTNTNLSSYLSQLGDVYNPILDSIGNSSNHIAIEEHKKICNAILQKFSLPNYSTAILDQSESFPSKMNIASLLGVAFEVHQIFKDVLEVQENPGQLWEKIFPDEPEYWDTPTSPSGYAFLHDASTIIGHSVVRVNSLLCLWLEIAFQEDIVGDIMSSSAADIISIFETSDPPDRSSALHDVRKTIQTLGGHPHSFEKATIIYVDKRKTVLKNLFLGALTLGMHSSTKSPIDIQSLDTEKYITEISVWIQNSIINEKELVGLLFDLQGSEQITKFSKDALLNCFSSVFDLFVERVDPMINSRRSPVLLLKIWRLSEYFNSKLRNLIGSDETTTNEQLKCYQKLGIMVKNSINEYWELQALKMHTMSLGNIFTSNLHPGDFIQSLCRDLGDYLQFLKDQPLGEFKEEYNEPEEVLTTLDATVTPMINFIRSIRPKLPPVDGCIVILNVYNLLMSTIRVHEDSAERVKLISFLIEEEVELFSNRQVEGTLVKIGLSETVKELKDVLQKNEDEVSHPLLNVTSFTAALNKFVASLEEPELVFPPQIALISNRSLRSQTRQSFSFLISQIYEDMYGYATQIGIKNIMTIEKVKTFLEG